VDATVIRVEGKTLRTSKDRQRFIREMESGNYEGTTLTEKDVSVTLIQGVGYELEIKENNEQFRYEGYNAEGNRDS